MSDESDRDWQLRAWMRYRGKKQADLVRDLDWNRGRASKVYNGSLTYKRDVVNQVADWLEIRPFELFLKPEEALALRRLRETARIIVEGI